MKNMLLRRTLLRTQIASAVALIALVPAAATAQPYLPQAGLTWQTVANSATAVPGGGGKVFRSFNQPSVNASGLVVLRGSAVSGSGGGEPLRGIYKRRVGQLPTAPTTVFDTLTEVPQPNNTVYNGALTKFTEFPAFPRIGRDNATIATRGQSQPVWTYTLPDGSETRVGTSGVFAQGRSGAATAMSLLGAVPGYAYYAVPGAPAGTRFDQFPGSPAVADANTIVVKGNYTDAGVSKTGIFFRNIAGQSPTQVIASSDTTIPGQKVGGVRFGSTAPPSAADGSVVFLGVDNEDAPTLGGIYRAPLSTSPTLQPLVTIGGQVPGEGADARFARLGEGLSFDGRYLGFWGAWGSETRTVTLTCPTDGNPDIVAACLEQYPGGTTTVQVPVHQGFFVHDLQRARTFAVAKTGANFQDFVYWTFSGQPPGVGGSEGETEPPRWRSASFVAVTGLGGELMRAAFKGQSATTPGVDGLYLATPARQGMALQTLVETGTPAVAVDPSAPAGALVTTVGLERDSLRGSWLAISVGMLDAATSESWAGIYASRTSR